MADLDEIYNTKLLELAAHIPCSERLQAPDSTATAHSKLCGSTVTIDLKMSGDRVTNYGQTVKPVCSEEGRRDRRRQHHRATSRAARGW
jgi:hypothetical protein